MSDRTDNFVSAFLPKSGKLRQFKFDDFEIGISLNRKLARSIPGQLMALTSINLLSRFTRRLFLHIEIDTPRRVHVPGTQSADLGRSLVEFTQRIDPSLNVELGDAVKQTVDAVVAIGPSRAASPFSVTINSDGWLAELSDLPDLDYISSSLNPLGAHAAASLGAAEVFKEILRKLGSDSVAVQKRVSHVRFSTLDFSTDMKDPPNPELPQRIRTENAYLVGAGAVGSALVYAMRHVRGLTGNLSVMDFDAIDITNLNRYPTAIRSDVGRAKVDVVSDFLRGTNVSVLPFRMSYESFVKEAKPEKLPLVISTVDNDQAREHIQSDLPREVLHGATHEQTFVISRHDFIHGACLGCLFFRKPKSYSEQIADETGIALGVVERVLETNGPFSAEHLATMVEKRGVVISKYSDSIGRPFKDVYAKEICGTLTINVNNKVEAATTSFVSVMPGILLTAEILKQAIPELANYRLNNYFQMSLFSPNANIPFFRQKDPRCVSLCFDSIMLDRYHQKWS